MKKAQQIILVLSIFFLSCENEPFEILIGKINVNSALFTDLKNLTETTPEDPEVVCLTFVYPFNVYLYNEDGEIADSRIVHNNIEFTELLGQMQNENAIGLSYPISGTTENGASISINDNLELKEAIEACIEDQIIRYCNNLLEEKNCVWKIESQNENDLYNDSLLDFYEDGTGVFYHNGNSYRTSWISLFIEEQLHINIHLEGDSSVSKDWNFDWEASIIDEDTILIQHNDQSFEIKKNCNLDNNCDYVEFRECEISDGENAADFVFNEYIDCIISFDENTDVTGATLTFYETIDDANQQINPLDTTSYRNITNPQIVFVHIEDTNNETSEIIRIVLLAVSCNNNQ
ncbi:hypothetical protein [Aquimarina sp. 2201CG14-23]|uniref:hypothetical protein n=1 Tax=Aquimarina mycalae TaxID=3040073 RepID=UPI002477F8FA|nr:hypothetical protein [Aquimarina sp. 2201CG14-23]MDH7445123.1 hypothetical protein [Aquimarina sp. 2201CG14-23]